MKLANLLEVRELEAERFDEMQAKRERLNLRLDRSAKEIERLDFEIALASITPEAAPKINFRGIE